ncbi:hypothetical protein HK102_008348 [Quaeritorhiza haematococci]|nr:hypothetical protein HK102_008348 [Quaeritorhiza haematococci]
MWVCLNSLLRSDVPPSSIGKANQAPSDTSMSQSPRKRQKRGTTSLEEHEICPVNIAKYTTFGTKELCDVVKSLVGEETPVYIRDLHRMLKLCEFSDDVHLSRTREENSQAFHPDKSSSRKRKRADKPTFKTYIQMHSFNHTSPSEKSDCLESTTNLGLVFKRKYVVLLNMSKAELDASVSSLMDQEKRSSLQGALNGTTTMVTGGYTKKILDDIENLFVDSPYLTVSHLDRLYQRVYGQKLWWWTDQDSEGDEDRPVRPTEHYIRSDVPDLDLQLPSVSSSDVADTRDKEKMNQRYVGLSWTSIPCTLRGRTLSSESYRFANWLMKVGSKRFVLQSIAAECSHSRDSNTGFGSASDSESATDDNDDRKSGMMWVIRPAPPPTSSVDDIKLTSGISTPSGFAKLAFDSGDVKQRLRRLVGMVGGSICMHCGGRTDTGEALLWKVDLIQLCKMFALAYGSDSLPRPQQYVVDGVADRAQIEILSTFQAEVERSGLLGNHVRKDQRGTKDDEKKIWATTGTKVDESQCEQPIICECYYRIVPRLEFPEEEGTKQEQEQEPNSYKSQRSEQQV